MKRYFIAIFCAIIYLGSLALPANNAEANQLFIDIPKNHYAAEAIQWAYEFDIINGYPDGTFRPNQAVTEQQFAQIFVNYFDLEPVEEELMKFSKKQIASDAIYNTLAAYQVPLNGYFDNQIRSSAVTRGTVAQALAYMLNGDTTLNSSIQFLLDYYITSGQNPKYENTNLQRYFGASNHLTRAQLVVFFYKLQAKSFFYISPKAEQNFENTEQYTLNKRANLARNILDKSLRKGSNWSTEANNKPNKTWNGEYTYFYTYGNGDIDSRGRILSITNSSKSSFNVTYYTYDGWNSGTVEGVATIVSDKKARLNKTSEGTRCVIEFEKIGTNSIKTTEFYCEAGRDKGTNYNGTLTLETN
ncbi:S-layer homology domain-containing protein [Solibacillus sp. MA9]|uniref:S-layer homology domain-containing protein n=1 Tax=Solibacillus palustris TaxID=2908203 RepID=A0ABS9U7E5_9BACL|nr:S-layer homology domain-containing protein [Solibacillus sp. MA9]